MNKIYAGIGSRQTPIHVQAMMTNIGSVLGKAKFTLRSGGADGADTVFELGSDIVNGQKEIYLPWKGFNDNQSELIGVCDKALELAAKYHPAWKAYLARPIRALLARNGYQVLGKDLNTPADFIICYTNDGATSHAERTKNTGGTGQAISIAEAYKIPIFNLGKANGYEALKQHLQLFYNLDI